MTEPAPRGRRSWVAGWSLWTLPVSAWAFLLAVELVALALTAALLAIEPVPGSSVWVRFGVLAVLAVAYSELAARSQAMQRYLGLDRVYGNPMSVWSYAAALTLPAGYAAVFVIGQWAHLGWQQRHDVAGRPHRAVFSAAAVVLAQLAAAGILTAGPRIDGPHGQVLDQLVWLAGIPAFIAINAAVLVVGMWLAIRPPSPRVLLPDADTLATEAGTLVLGVATGILLVHAAVLTPVVLVLVALLHRSGVVKDLQKTASTDSKTGLLTAAAWTKHTAAVLHRGLRARRGVALLLVDVDHFKTVNDTYGHLTGDQVLATIADCLRQELRGHDGIGRFGGEEFVAVLDGPTPAEAVGIAERVRVAIRDHAGMTTQQAPAVTVSIGVAHTRIPRQDPPTTWTLDGLLHDADQALYAAKHAGRNQVVLFAPALDQEILP